MHQISTQQNLNKSFTPNSKQIQSLTDLNKSQNYKRDLLDEMKSQYDMLSESDVGESD